MPMINLDTHVLIHALQGGLRKAEDELLRDAEWGISAIVLWEIAKLVELDRIDMDLDDPDTIASLRGVHVWPLDLDVGRASTGLDFGGDPADQIIAATSVVHGVPLLTRDRRILRSKSVPLAGRR
jgi:PIN domain nuclease of toxin-antitoxin system